MGFYADMKGDPLLKYFEPSEKLAHSEKWLARKTMTAKLKTRLEHPLRNLKGIEADYERIKFHLDEHVEHL